MNGVAIQFDAEWRTVRTRLKRLLELRNQIVHGKREPVAALLRATAPSLSEEAASGYDALIDAIRVISVAIGYEYRTGNELEDYYRALQVGA